MLNQCDNLLNKVNRLPYPNHIQQVLPTLIKNYKTKIEITSEVDLKYSKYTPLIHFLDTLNMRQLKSFNNSFENIHKLSTIKSQNEIIQNLKLTEDKQREWFGFLFESFCKSVVFKKNKLKADFKFVNENGKNPDIKISIHEKPFILECTTLNPSDDDEYAWTNFLEEKKLDSNVVMMRPGKYDKPNSKSPSWYYDTNRFYLKVYDKLAKDLNLQNCQLSSYHPNILLISLNSGYTGLNHSLGIGWAIDELFSEVRYKSDVVNNHSDSSFSGWLSKHRERMLSQYPDKKEDLKKYFVDNWDAISFATKKISAIYIFDRFKLIQSRINYNAYEANKISHKEAAVIDKLFSKLPIWIV